MPTGDSEAYSNPLAPTNYEIDDEDDAHALTNDDFRKMLMTPKPGQRSQENKGFRKPLSKLPEDDDDDPATKRRKKKSYYAKLKRLEEERQKELEERYRDRASERRHGVNKDYSETEIMSTTADYRAVAPDQKAGDNYAERRKQMIQESKYLGGDMEHTHLVKGLDFALLEKVRAEISIKEREDEEEMEKAVTQKKSDEEKLKDPKDGPSQPAALDKKAEPKVEDPEEKINFKTKMGRNVFRILFKNKPPDRNELFLPGRMAYIVDLEDEFADSDVPCTTIRSKADCPSLEATTTLTTNDIVINKLTQILSYLRAGRRESKKMRKKEKGKLKDEDKTKQVGADEGIYPEVDVYQPNMPKSRDKKDKRDRGREDEKGRDRGERNARDGRGDRERDRDHRDNRDRDRDRGRDRGDRDRRDRERDHRGDRDGGRDRERNRDAQRGGDRDRDTSYREERKRKSYFEKPVEEDEDNKNGTAPTASEMVKNINERFVS